ncbi:hypothetical protein GCM10018965_009430 [Nonomuraea roseola]
MGTTQETRLNVASIQAAIGKATAIDPAMLSMALRLRDQDLSLREIASRLVITQGAKRGRPGGAESLGPVNASLSWTLDPRAAETVPARSHGSISCFRS